ncbi:DUF6916 family protein [Rhizobium chutanense]|nr:hypothetical protein [Rhizobium chutanense]
MRHSNLLISFNQGMKHWYLQAKREQASGVRMAIVTLDHFARCVGEGFEVDMGTGLLVFTLTEARPLPERGFAEMVRAPFSLLFRSASKVLLPQQIYRLRNATLGILDIFLVPVARDKDGIIYQAIFN